MIIQPFPFVRIIKSYSFDNGFGVAVGTSEFMVNWEQTINRRKKKEQEVS